MARFKLLLSEAVRSLGANVSTTVAATMTVLIGMFLLGFLIGLATWGFSVGNHYKRELVVKVFFNRDATTKEITELRTRLLADPRVKSVALVTPQEALKKVEKQYPVYKSVKLPSNPEPPVGSLTWTLAVAVTSLWLGGLSLLGVTLQLLNEGALVSILTVSVALVELPALSLTEQLMV